MKPTSKLIIISPSGNFYGSEQVLYNHLNNTDNNFIVYVPKKSVLLGYLNALNNHEIRTFTSVKLLYLRIFSLLMIGVKNAVYINEGGHIKYAKLLGNLLPWIKVFVHVRLIEDTDPIRLKILPNNLRLISISNYISQQLNGYPNIKIYDPLDTKDINLTNIKLPSKFIKVGIIGRVSVSKGIHNYDALLNFCIKNKITDLSFTFYGDLMLEESTTHTFVSKYKDNSFDEILFAGFESNQEKIFSSVDLVLHLNENEPLGRIGLESWARGIPFICFNSGGVAEINEKLGMSKFLIEKNDNWEARVIDLIRSGCDILTQDDIELAQINIERYFGVKRYVDELENFFIN